MIDHASVRQLLADVDIKARFIDEIDGPWIFNINTFIDYIFDRNFLTNSNNRFRNRIGLNFDGKFLRERGEVSLVWPYKDCVLEGGQTKEEEKRKEIFFNEILSMGNRDAQHLPTIYKMAAGTLTLPTRSSRMRKPKEERIAGRLFSWALCLPACASSRAS